MDNHGIHHIVNTVVYKCERHRRFLVVIITAIIIRFLLAWFVTHSDAMAWMKTIQNVESGIGLYELEGLWYTPVFGYLLSFMSLLGDILGLFPIQYTSVPEFISSGYNNLPTPEFNLFIKIPMIIGDFLVAFLIYKLVNEFKDERWALIATAMWLLSPIIWHMSSAQGQFDALCIALFLISYMCLRKDQFALSGVFLALSVWLKIFPVLCGPLMLIYIYKKFDDKTEMKKSIFLFFAGIIATSFIVFLPQLINGEMAEAFKFILSRTTSHVLASQLLTFRIYITAAIVAVMLLILCRKLNLCNDGNNDRMLLVYSMFLVACGASISMGYQYAPSIILCLIMLVLFVKDGRKWFIGSFVAISILTYLEAAQHIGQMHFAIAAVYYGWFDVGKLATDYIIMTENTQMLFLGITALWQIIATVTILFAFVCFVWPEKIGFNEVENELDD